jgi:7-cyano-7-deazaguanine synthase
MSKVLLYSGGMDSWLISKIINPDVKLYVNLHSRYSQAEISRLGADVVVEDLDLSKWEREDSIIPLRNLYLCAVASNYGNEIYLGATQGDRVLDKSFKFADLATAMLSFLYKKQHWTEERHVTVNVDFKRYTKSQLLALYLDNSGTIKEAFDNSFSCYSPVNGEECWECKACLRKWVAFANNGYFHTCQAPFVIKKEILPLIEKGVYDRKAEVFEIVKSINDFNNLL